MPATLRLVLLAALCAASPAIAEDWTTISGKKYQDVHVVKVEADAVTILTHDGGALVPLILLPPELQTRFHYDPEKAKAAAYARDKADFQNAHALHTEQAETVAAKQHDSDSLHAAAQAHNAPRTEPPPEAAILDTHNHVNNDPLAPLKN